MMDLLQYGGENLGLPSVGRESLAHPFCLVVLDNTLLPMLSKQYAEETS